MLRMVNSIKLNRDFMSLGIHMEPYFDFCSRGLSFRRKGNRSVLKRGTLVSATRKTEIYSSRIVMFLKFRIQLNSFFNILLYTVS